MPSHVDFIFWSFFWWLFASNFDPWNLKNQALAAARARFIKNSFFAIRIDVSSILVPTCFHFRSENPPKLIWKSIVKGINFLIDSCIGFLLILARFWKPTWRHVGNFFGQNGCTLWCLPLFLPGSMFLSEFLAVLTSLLPKMSRAAPRFWTVLGSILECFGLHFGSSWWLFVRFSVSIFFTIFEST